MSSHRRRSPSRTSSRSPQATAPAWQSMLNLFGGGESVSLPRRKTPLGNRRLAMETLEDRVVLATDISFAGNVLTVNVGAAGETAALSVAGTNLTVTSSTDVTVAASAAAAPLSFVDGGAT